MAWASHYCIQLHWLKTSIEAWQHICIPSVRLCWPAFYFWATIWGMTTADLPRTFSPKLLPAYMDTAGVLCTIFLYGTKQESHRFNLLYTAGLWTKSTVCFEEAAKVNSNGAAARNTLYHWLGATLSAQQDWVTHMIILCVTVIWIPASWSTDCVSRREAEGSYLLMLRLAVGICEDRIHSWCMPVLPKYCCCYVKLPR